MAVDVNKLIKDAQAAQAAARTAAQSAQAQAAKDKSSAEIAALSKKQLEYANSLKPTLADYEARLKIWANKIARGDKLSAIEQKEFNGLVSDYNSVNKTVNAAIKKANDIIVEGRRKAAGSTTPSITATKTTTTASGPDAARAGLPSSTVTPASKPAPTATATPTPTPISKNKPAPVVSGNTSFTEPMTISGQTDAVAGTPVVDNSGTAIPASDLQTLLKKTEFWYDLPDYIFNTVPGLGDLLVKAVNEGWDNEKFLAAAKGTTWWQKNSSNLRTRIIDRAKYDELKAAGEDVSKTDYGLYLKKQIGSVKDKARQLAGVALTDEQAQSVAQKIYDGFLDDDPLAINALIVPFIGKVSSIAGTGTGAQGITGYSGQALQNYQTLQSIAKANGFSIKDILPGISTSTTGGDLETAVLQKLALGEIDINRVAQDARTLAAQGQPQYVRNLLNQGYDLENIYAPYKNQMAAVLEVNPDKIDLNDPTLRSAITDKGDMNLYDFKRQLRQDNRWQYTQCARDEVSSGVKTVLQDFGFQG